MIDPKRAIFVPISGLKRLNIVVSMEEYNESLCEALIRMAKINNP